MVAIRGAVPLGEVVTAITPMVTALASFPRCRRGARRRGAGQRALHHGRPPDARRPRRRPGSRTTGGLSCPWARGFIAPRWCSADPRWPPATYGRSARWPGTREPVAPRRRPGSVTCTGGGRWRWSTDLDGDAASGAATGTADDVMAAVGPEAGPSGDPDARGASDARPSAAEVALALYRAAAPEPVGLVGHHPDPAAATPRGSGVTPRRRGHGRQLREEERAERRHDRRQRQRRRVRRRWPHGLPRVGTRASGWPATVGCAGRDRVRDHGAVGTPLWRLRLVPSRSPG